MKRLVYSIAAVISAFVVAFVASWTLLKWVWTDDLSNEPWNPFE